MRILVIGATGMLGQPVARKLQASGHSVRIMARAPERARGTFDDSFEIVPGDVTDPDSVGRAMIDCKGVHISLNGGPTAADYERIEHQGTRTIAQAAVASGVRHLTYLAGISAREHNAHFPSTAAKLGAIAAIRESGMTYTVFRPQWFFESLPLFIRGHKAILFGRMVRKWRWLAATDYAEMVAKAYATPEAGDEILDCVGPEPLSLTEAMTRYCAACRPEVSITHIPFWRANLISFMTGNQQLRNVVSKMKFWDAFEEIAKPEHANRILGEPQTTLAQWLIREKTRNN